MTRREYALRPGTQAPLVGTLMEVVRALRCPDGRLIILALGVGRMRVRERHLHPCCWACPRPPSTVPQPARNRHPVSAFDLWHAGGLGRAAQQSSQASSDCSRYVDLCIC